MGIADQSTQTAPGTPRVEDSLFDTGSDLGADHMTYRERLFDGPPTRRLEQTGPGPGSRCLVATEVGPKRVQDVSGVELHCSDITEGLPVEGLEPGFTAWASQLICIRGRKPA